LKQTRGKTFCCLILAGAPEYSAAPSCASRATGFPAIGQFRPFKANYSCLLKPANDQEIFLDCQLNVLRRKTDPVRGLYRRLKTAASPAQLKLKSTGWRAAANAADK
jgi:hypothetical protein